MAKSKPLPASKHAAHHEDSDHDEALSQQSTTALQSARRNFTYFLDPTKAPPGARPARLRTRALLRSLRYITQFIFWRLVRWAKYAAVASLVAAVGAGMVGSVASGAAFIAAPTGIGASIIAASVWGVGRFAARRLNRRWKRSGGDAGVVVRERVGDVGIEARPGFGNEVGGMAVPW